MNPAALGNEDNASAPVLHMALELSNKSWRLALSDGARRRQVSVPAADLMKLSQAVAKAKERFGMPASARVVSCYEAGRDGFWLHRHLRGMGIENEVIDAASIEVSRRLRHVKTDRLDGDRLLDKLIRHHAGERGRPDRGSASSESGSSCPLRAHAASGVRLRMPARIEGGDERITLALTIESGQPTPPPLTATKTAREM